MTYTEREIARLEGMKDGLIKKLVEECEEINDQIIALRKGTPRKKDSEIYFDRGYIKGRADAIVEYTCKSDCEHDGSCEMCVRWNKLADCYEPPKEQLKEQSSYTATVDGVKREFM